MIRIRGDHYLFLSVLTIIHFSKHAVSCAPAVIPQSAPSSSLSVSATTFANNDHLAFAEFYADLRVISLAAELITKIPRKFYFTDCTEKDHLKWYLNEYPMDCQVRFSKANTLKDLVAIYCNPLCGNMYLNYMKKCGQTALEMANYYRNLCFGKV